MNHAKIRLGPGPTTAWLIAAFQGQQWFLVAPGQIQRRSDTAESSLTHAGDTDGRDGIIAKLYAVLLYPELSAYKVGLLERCLHHIRLHPSEYEIPDNVKPFMFTRDFAKHISASLATCRAELKRKMGKTWTSKQNIYGVVKKLVGNLKSQITVNDATWHRWAWIHLKHADFQELVKSGEKKNSLFWDWLDDELEALRKKFAHLLEPERSQRLSRIFELSLQTHIRARPTKRLASPNKRASAWQTAIYASINEMQSYTHDVLAREEGCDGEEAEDEDQRPEGSEGSGNEGDGANT